jgi:hypothetical protein
MFYGTEFTCRISEVLMAAVLRPGVVLESKTQALAAPKQSGPVPGAQYSASGL